MITSICMTKTVKFHKIVINFSYPVPTLLFPNKPGVWCQYLVVYTGIQHLKLSEQRDTPTNELKCFLDYGESSWKVCCLPVTEKMINGCKFIFHWPISCFGALIVLWARITKITTKITKAHSCAYHKDVTGASWCLKLPTVYSTAYSG